MNKTLVFLLLALLSTPALAAEVEIYVRVGDAPWGEPLATLAMPEESASHDFAQSATFATDCPVEDAACVPTTRTHSIDGTLSRDHVVDADGKPLAALAFNLREQGVKLEANIPVSEDIIMDFTDFEPTKQVQLRVRTVARSPQ